MTEDPKVKFFFLFFFSVILSAWTVEAASSGESAGWGWMEGVGRFVNLFILFGIIYYFVREPIGKFFDERRLSIQRRMSQARREEEEATAKLTSIEVRVKDLDKERAALREEAEKEAAAERRRLLDQAQQDAEKIVAAARRDIDHLTRVAQKELREYAAHLSVELAERQVRREMSEQDEERVVERFFVKFGPSGPMKGN